MGCLRSPKDVEKAVIFLMQHRVLIDGIFNVNLCLKNGKLHPFVIQFPHQ